MTTPDPQATPSRMPRRKGQPAPADRKPAANTVTCPACESRVDRDSIDRSALSAAALQALDTAEKRGKYKSDAALIEQARAKVARRMQTRVGGPQDAA